MEESNLKYERLKPQIHICPICGKRSEWFSVHAINQNSPCGECDQKRKDKENV